ncbi:MAG TPA: hypothetical protein PKD61_00530, partial [Polyangiaceae bacterium]|nr:hypothetical protein [Polyangiaceae bacterium]
MKRAGKPWLRKPCRDDKAVLSKQALFRRCQSEAFLHAREVSGGLRSIPWLGDRDARRRLLEHGPGSTSDRVFGS